MTLVELKKSLHEKIDGLNDPLYLDMLNKMIGYKDKLFQIPAEHLDGIERGSNDIENGDFLTMQKLRERYEWLKD